MRALRSIPEGDRLLWQATPDWRHFAVSAVPLPWVALYVTALVGFCAINGAWNVAAAYAMLSAVALGMLALLAFAMARSATYSITHRHVVIEYGFALPKTVTLPLTRIASAGLRANRDGTGDISLRLGDNHGLSPLILWPHVRLVRLRAEPVLRAIPAAEAASAILAHALAATDQPAPIATPLAAPVAAQARALETAAA